jgi:hypothetical protein
MSFMVFQLLFALVALALVVIAVIVVRQLAAKRRLGEQALSEPELPGAAEAKAPKLRMGLGRKAPEPEPEAEEAAPPRRRQLHSFAEAERTAAEADAVVLPVLEPAVEPEAEPVLEASFAPAAEAEPEAEHSAEFEAEHMTDEALDYGEAVMGRLEEAFEDLQAGDITLDAYRQRMQSERAAVEARIAALQPAGDSAELDAAQAAHESVLWCLDWAEEQVSAEQQ